MKIILVAVRVDTHHGGSLLIKYYFDRGELGNRDINFPPVVLISNAFYVMKYGQNCAYLCGMCNQMKTSLNLTIVFLLITVGGAAQKRHFGNYFNKWRYWGPMFVLKADSTFEYNERTNAGTVTITEPTQYGTSSKTTDSYIFTDSSYGTYNVVNDTIFFSYATDEVKGEFNGYNIRPKKLYWKGKALYYIHLETGVVIRQKEYYMTWSKKKTPNLSKTDETYSQRFKLN